MIESMQASKQVNLLSILCNKAAESKPVKLEAYLIFSPHKVGDNSLNKMFILFYLRLDTLFAQDYLSCQKNTYHLGIL